MGANQNGDGKNSSQSKRGYGENGIQSKWGYGKNGIQSKRGYGKNGSQSNSGMKTREPIKTCENPENPHPYIRNDASSLTSGSVWRPLGNNPDSLAIEG